MAVPQNKNDSLPLKKKIEQYANAEKRKMSVQASLMSTDTPVAEVQ